MAGDPKLSAAAKAALGDPNNERVLSPISMVEIALKARLGKLTLSAPFGALFPAHFALNRIDLLPIEARHVEPLTTLPLHHKDPFDRLIAATALIEGLTLVSADAAFDSYGMMRLW